MTCETATLDHCESCGCYDDPANPRCDASTGQCAPPAGVGEPCRRDDECSTLNCSVFAGVCRVPVGQACTANNCDRCLSGSGFSFCSRECGYPFSHDCNGNPCLGNSETDIYTCRPGCDSLSDSFCPASCEYASDYSTIFCDCDDNECAPLVANREEGAWCRYSSQCEGGDCYYRDPCAGQFYSGCSYGWCSVEGCTSDADCTEGTRCVDIPCGGLATRCGARCLPTCTDSYDCDRSGLQVGGCRTRALVGGGEASVCDVKSDGGGPCVVDADCITADCIDGQCAYDGPAPNGANCAAPSDCASNNCPSGQCIGNALIGAGCAGPYDCAVGVCCAFGPNVDTCQSSC